MMNVILRVMPLALCIIGATALSAQMSGTYTVANGNPGAAFDYGDLGDAFTALETSGMSGSVTIEVYDDGGAFTSAADYGLGIGAANADAPISGLSATNTLTIKAAQFESPVINGTGANGGLWTSATGTLVFNETSNVTVEGLEVTGGTYYGFQVFASGTTSTNFTIRNCKIHGVSTGSAIFIYGNGTAFNNVTIENNMMWDCRCDTGTAQFAGSLQGVIGARSNSAGSGWVFRHNTILLNNGNTGAKVFMETNGPSQWTAFTDNIFYVSSTTSATFWNWGGTPPTGTDRNIVYLGSNAVMSNNASINTWALWQSSGYDPNGSSSDPLFVNTSIGNEDLHLQATSPAINLATASTTAKDIDTETRAIGTNRDSGADEYSDAELDVQRASSSIAVSGNDPLGNVSTAGVTFTWTIANSGTTRAEIFSNVVVTAGTGSPTVAVTAQPSQFIATSASTTFQISVTPALGNFDFSISFHNNDKDESPYAFTASGVGVLANGPAVSDPASGSSITGNQNGPFTLSLAPGATLTSASLELTDPDSDNITVSAISATTSVPTGVTAPSIPSTGHPITLTWTGTASASNTPGTYSWDITFADSVNGTNVTVTLNLIIQDVAPTHVAATGQPAGANGTGASPYTASFQETDTTALSTDLADVADANTGQSVSVSTTSQTGGPTTGSGFSFSVIGGNTLAVSPAATLSANDVGTQVFDVTITDGTNNVTVVCSVTVAAQTNPTFTPTTPGVSIMQTGSQANVDVGIIADVQDPVSSLSVATTSVPTGVTVSAIAINTTNGTVTCTIAVGIAVPVGATNITFEVTDSTARTGTGVYSFTVTASTPPTITPGSTVIVLEGQSVSGVTIATVTDAEDTAGALTVTATTVPSGLSVSNIQNNAGTITADISAASGIGAGSFVIVLQVTDSGGSSTPGNLNVDVMGLLAVGSGGGGGGGGGCGCAADGAIHWWMLLVSLFSIIVLARTRRRAAR